MKRPQDEGPFGDCLFWRRCFCHLPRFQMIPSKPTGREFPELPVCLNWKAPRLVALALSFRRASRQNKPLARSENHLTTFVGCLVGMVGQFVLILTGGRFTPVSLSLRFAVRYASILSAWLEERGLESCQPKSQFVPTELAVLSGLSLCHMPTAAHFGSRHDLSRSQVVSLGFSGAGKRNRRWKILRCFCAAWRQRARACAPGQ